VRPADVWKISSSQNKTPFPRWEQGLPAISQPHELQSDHTPKPIQPSDYPAVPTMRAYRHKKKLDLSLKYPPSGPCSCAVCLAYCRRPGWWSVEEARAALDGGLGARMMLELAPEGGWGVLSPAFRGNEGYYATQEASVKGCNFLKDGLCELFDTGFEPLECRFCHHERVGQGPECHAALERDWHTPAGQALVREWSLGRGLNLKG
jgi:hypothetical protein